MRAYRNAYRSKVKCQLDAQLGNFIDVFLARHVLGTNAHHQEH